MFCHLTLILNYDYYYGPVIMINHVVGLLILGLTRSSADADTRVMLGLHSK